jgi:hypothetical protein
MGGVIGRSHHQLSSESLDGENMVGSDPCKEQFTTASISFVRCDRVAPSPREEEHMSTKHMLN